MIERKDINENLPAANDNQIVWSNWQSFSNLIHNYPNTATGLSSFLSLIGCFSIAASGLSSFLSFTCIVPVVTIIARYKEDSPENRLFNLMNRLEDIDLYSLYNLDLSLLVKDIDELAFSLNNESVNEHIRKKFEALSENIFDNVSERNRNEINAIYEALHLNSKVLQHIKPKWAGEKLKLNNNLITTLILDSFAQVESCAFNNVENIPISKDILQRGIGFSFIGSNFLRKAGESSFDISTTRVLDASLVAVSKDGKAVYGAIADGYGHANDPIINKKIARAALAAVSIAVNKSAKKPDEMTDFDFINKINDKVFNSFAVDEKTRGSASLCYYKCEIIEWDMMKITAVNIGNCMLIAYSPSEKEWSSIAPATLNSPRIGGEISKRKGDIIGKFYYDDEAYRRVELIKKDATIIAMTNGVYDYLTCKDLKKQYCSTKKILDFEQINKDLSGILSTIEDSNNPAEILLKALRDLSLKNQSEIINKDMDSETLKEKYGDDFTAHAVQPLKALQVKSLSQMSL